jgi:DDE superfamily endonuclease
MKFSQLILLVLLHESQEEENDKKHSQYRKRFHNCLSAIKQQKRMRRIPRVALHNPNYSAWRQLFASKNGGALITLTGFDYRTFLWLKDLFVPIYNMYSPHTSPDGRIIRCDDARGRRRLLRGVDLGLCLAWTRTKGSTITLQMIFGMTHTSVGIYIRFARRILIKCLEKNPQAAIRVPDAAMIECHKQEIRNRHPLLTDVWCTMDGLKLRLQSSGNTIIQRKYYNGWTHDQYVTGVFVFCPYGTIPICCYNLPGSLHDSKVADHGKIYEKLMAVYDESNGMCTADSAFAAGRFPCLIKSAQRTRRTNHMTDEEYQYAVDLNKQATSMRQSAEWGMRALQGSFPRITDRFVYEEFGERKLIVKMC